MIVLLVLLMLLLILIAVVAAVLTTARVVEQRAYRRGLLDGRHATVRELILCKDNECWTAAHYLEEDAFQKAETERYSRKQDKPAVHIGKLLK